MGFQTVKPNDDSILNSVKKGIGGLDPSYNVFDAELIASINSVFMALNQMGVDHYSTPFYITDSTAIWSDYLGDDTRIQGVKTYVALKVRSMFDPPSGSAKESFDSVIKELEYRIYQEREFCEDAKNE